MAAAGCDFGASLVGYDAMRYEVSGQGSPFSGDRLIVHPMLYHAMSDRIDRKRPHRLCDQRLPDLASQRHMNSPTRVAAIRCIRSGHTTIGYLRTVELP